MIEHLQLVIAKMKREMFGPRSERSQRLLDQLELQLEELVAARTSPRHSTLPLMTRISSTRGLPRVSWA
jgi:hypothetical protein